MIGVADGHFSVFTNSSTSFAWSGTFTPAQSHAAAGWGMNRHAYRLTQRFAFRYGSDTRGICPFMPVRNAEVILCPQLPTTLPSLDEIMAGVPL